MGIRDLRATYEHLDGLPPLLKKIIEQGLGGILTGMDSLRREHEQLAVTPRRQLLSIHRLTVTLVILGLLSIGSSVACLILLLIR
jgi:hypothetical protein